MRDWKLQPGDPLSLVICSDARLGPTDYLDDQIWELMFGGGEPPAVSLNTTYGLRAKSARIFPRFSEGESLIQDPDDFVRTPIISKLFPNFIALEFSPFSDIDVNYEIWVPNSHVIAGRVSIWNQANVERRLQTEIVGQLSPDDGQRMAPFETSETTLLYGSSGDLTPVVLMTGGVKSGPGPHPSLSATMQLAPGEKRQIVWVCAAMSDRETSYAQAKEISSQNWDAVISRIEMLAAGSVEIYTGEPTWDAALMLSQKVAASLIAGPTPHLPYPSLLLTRQPDQGYSLRGDGTDFTHLWNGQSAFETQYLSEILLPVDPEIVKGLIRNFLSVQDSDGAIDWKPGLAGQRNHAMITPLLVSLIYRIYEQTEDIKFLEEVFPGVCRYLENWLSPTHDRDRDGIPEWDNSLQPGFDEHPIYSRWQSGSLNIDITTSESVSLSSLLFQEITLLNRISQILSRESDIAELIRKADSLKDAVESSWENEFYSYFDRDRDSHISTKGELILESKGSGIFQIRRKFENPVRLRFQIITDETIRRHPLIFLHGKSASGNSRIEKIGDEQFRWMPGIGLLTSQYVYSQIDRIEIRGLEPEDQIKIENIDFRYIDISLLAPLYAGIPDENRAEKLVQETITYPGLFWREFGLPAFPRPPSFADQATCLNVNLMWNILVGKGLIKYGYQPQAVELLTRLMSAIINSLKKNRAFRRGYHAETGQGTGENNALSGLAPVGFFLDVLGVRLIDPKRVGLSGFNPFPWPVTVKYRGMTIMRQHDKTTVIFPDNQTITVSDPDPRLVTLEQQSISIQEE